MFAGIWYAFGTVGEPRAMIMAGCGHRQTTYTGTLSKAKRSAEVRESCAKC